MDLDVSSKEYVQHIAVPILLFIWAILVISGLISLITGIVDQNVDFIWTIYFSNLLSFIPYALMFFPTLSIYINIRDVIEDKKIEDRTKILKALLTQVIIAALSSLIIIIILKEPILTTNLFYEFYALFSMWIFFISVITLVIFVLYSYFGEV
ncbi:MAG: hypothetical protein ACFE8B_00135 [Candidatus Hermodarchaeota archaeon]